MPHPVLVADFDLTRRYVIALALRSAGHDVIEVGDAGAAAAALTSCRCQLVFLAARLSGGDGFELCREWTARGVRVVLVASDFRGSELLRARARDVGAVALLSSTGDRERIAGLVQQLLGPGSALG